MKALAQRFHPSVLAGALWATFAAYVVRRRLGHVGLKASVPRPPRLSWQAERGVTGALRRLAPTCLERALVQQAWMASQGVDRDVVIGVPPHGMRNDPAHAWVDGADTVSPTRYLEIHRLSAPLMAKGHRMRTVQRRPSAQ